jgi:tetratricopeptide (TPR) repeat protein
VRPDDSHQSDPLFTRSAYKYLYVGDFYRQMGDPDRAIAAYEEALRLDIGRVVTRNRLVRLHLELADLFLKTGRPAQAEHLLRKGQQIDPGNAQCLNRLRQLGGAR